jgi:hypothetical protein
MNERIKLLAEQADAYADAMDYHGKNYIGLRDTYFAELIVQECVKAIESVEAGDTYDYDSYDEWLRGYSSGLRKATGLIVSHFEVEE